MTTLIVETGAGLASANTYYSLASVSAYCANQGYTSWSSLSTTIQMQSILRGMKYIEAQDWKGSKYDWGNGLEWPREGAVDRNNYLIGAADIPKQVKFATAEAAYRESVTADVLEPDLIRGGGIKRKKVDVLETEYFQGASNRTKFTKIDGLLRGLVYSSNCATVIRT